MTILVLRKKRIPHRQQLWDFKGIVCSSLKFSGNLFAVYFCTLNWQGERIRSMDLVYFTYFIGAILSPRHCFLRDCLHSEVVECEILTSDTFCGRPLFLWPIFLYSCLRLNEFSWKRMTKGRTTGMCYLACHTVGVRRKAEWGGPLWGYFDIERQTSSEGSAFN